MPDKYIPSEPVEMSDWAQITAAYACRSYDPGMDSTGRIHQMTPEHLAALDMKTLEDLTPIPEKMIGRVTFLSGDQKRAWRALVRSGVEAEVALLQVQQPAPGEMLDFINAVGRSK